MFDQDLPGSPDDPTVLRASAGASWAFVVFAAVFAFALVRGYLGAATTAGRIGIVFFMGIPMCLLSWAAIYAATHRSKLSISADAISYTKAASARARAAASQALVLDRSSGNDLSVVTAIRQGRKNVVGFTIQGSGVTLPLTTFGASKVRRACVAKGWQFPA